MKLKTIVFNSESEFRNYVIQRSNTIHRLIIFEDTLDSIIFFYGFCKNNVIVATKEPSYKNFSNFKNNYISIADELHLQIVLNINKTVEFCR